MAHVGWALVPEVTRPDVVGGEAGAGRAAEYHVTSHEIPCGESGHLAGGALLRPAGVEQPEESPHRCRTRKSPVDQMCVRPVPDADCGVVIGQGREGILVGSVVSGIAGWVILRAVTTPQCVDPARERAD